jgi:hypothetical protein
MGRTFSLLGMVMFTVGVVALSSLARRAPQPRLPSPSTEESGTLAPPPRRAIPVFAFEAPFSLN